MRRRGLGRVLVGVVAVVSLSACAQVYSDSVAEFNKGFTSAKQIIEDRAHAMDAVKRRKQLEAIFYADEDPAKIDENKLRDFSSSICAASDYLKKQQTDLATLGIYNEILTTTNTKPKADVASLWRSILENWKQPEAL